MKILTTENLTKIYKNGEEEIKALDGVSLSVEKGEFLAIVGSSGSGKSTLVHVLGGVDRPSSGKVFVNGRDISALSDTELALYRRRQVGIIYQFYNLIPVLTARENIQMPLLMDKKKPDPIAWRQLIEILGLRGRENHLPNRLSGGQQQRVAIGRRLVTGPDIVLADEPTGNLDSRNSKRIMDLLRELNRTFGLTLVVITHDASIARLADRTLVMADGRLSDGRDI